MILIDQQICEIAENSITTGKCIKLLLLKRLTCWNYPQNYIKLSNYKKKITVFISRKEWSLCIWISVQNDRNVAHKTATYFAKRLKNQRSNTNNVIWVKFSSDSSNIISNFRTFQRIFHTFCSGFRNFSKFLRWLSKSCCFCTG